MVSIKVNPKELEYWTTSDWDSLMIYLEEKFGKKFKNKIKSRLEIRFQALIDDEKNDQCFFLAQAIPALRIL